MNDARGVTSGIGVLYSSQMTGAIVRAITYMLMMNALGSFDFGIFSLSIAGALLIQLVTLGGTDWTLNVFYARRNEKRHKAAILVVGTILIVTIILFIG